MAGSGEGVRVRVRRRNAPAGENSGDSSQTQPFRQRSPPGRAFRTGTPSVLLPDGSPRGEFRAEGVKFARMGYTVNGSLSVDDQQRGWLYLGFALLGIVVFFVGHWILATYYPLDYGAGTVILLVMLALTIVGLYAAFRFYQLRHPQ